MSLLRSTGVRRALVLATALLLPSAALAVPVIHEAGWALTRTVTLQDANAAHYNPIDGLLYATRTRQIGDGGGLYRINADGTSTLIEAATRPVGVVVDPNTGNVFYSQLENGRINRYRLSNGALDPWVSGFHSGDDDPVGMAFAPSNYVGAHLNPGQAVVVDEGSNGPDEVWGWNFGSPQGEFVIHADTAGNPSPMGQPVDVAVSSTTIWVVDSEARKVWSLDANGDAVELSTSRTLGVVSAIAVDPLTGDLLVVDKISDEVLRIDPATGNTTVVFSGFSFIECCTDFAGLDVSPDGQRIFVTDRGSAAIYTFSLVPEPAALLLGLIGLVAFGTRRRARTA